MQVDAANQRHVSGFATDDGPEVLDSQCGLFPCTRVDRGGRERRSRPHRHCRVERVGHQLSSFRLTCSSTASRSPMRLNRMEDTRIAAAGTSAPPRAPKKEMPPPLCSHPPPPPAPAPPRAPRPPPPPPPQ